MTAVCSTLAPARPPLSSSSATTDPFVQPAPVVMDTTGLIAAYATHRETAHRLAQQILGDSSSADDAVQDSFLKLWKGNAQFDPSRGAMRGLVLTIARHSAIDLIRRRTRRERTENLYCTGATYVTEGPERETERTEESLAVREAVLALPKMQRIAIEMAYFSGLTRREIAIAEGVPVGTVKSRMRLAMAKLAETLQDRRGAGQTA